MPLVDFLYICPFCHHDPLVGEGDVASCPSCSATFQRGGEGGMIRVDSPAHGTYEVRGYELGSLPVSLHEPSGGGVNGAWEGNGERRKGEVRTAEVRVKTASLEKPVRSRGEIVGFSEVFGPETEGILKLSSDALTLWPMGGGSPPLRQWGLLDIEAVQTTSRSLQITPRAGGVVQFRFPGDSTRRWEELLHGCLRNGYRRRGMGEILEFQPRIVAAGPEGPEEGRVVRHGSRPSSSTGAPGRSGSSVTMGRHSDVAGPSFRGPFSWYRLLRPLAKLLLTLGSRLEVRGLENIPREGPFILVANHQSVLDPIFVQATCPRELHTLTKSTQFGIGLFGWLLPRLNAIPTRRYRVDPQVVRVVMRRLSRGEAVGIYPEGERSWDGTMQPFRRGTLRLLLGAGVPVVPCGLSGAYDAWPRWSRSLKRRRVALSFGAPMSWPHLRSRPEREKAVPWAMKTLHDEFKALGAWEGASSP